MLNKQNKYLQLLMSELRKSLLVQTDTTSPIYYAHLRPRFKKERQGAAYYTWSRILFSANEITRYKICAIYSKKDY